MVLKTEKSKRRPRGEWFWQAMVAACGDHCCAPGCNWSGPLEQGHIESHADGHDDNPENLIPLCRRCNAKYKKVTTPDGRPDGWRERFMMLVGHELQARFCMRQEKFACYMTPAGESTDSKEVISWPKPENGAVKALYTSSQTARRQALKLVEQVLDESRKRLPQPQMPKANRRAQLVKLAEGQPETFVAAVREFLLREDFLRDDAVLQDSWAPVCDNFATYARWAAERAAQRKVYEAKQRELQARLDAASKLSKKKLELAGLLRRLADFGMSNKDFYEYERRNKNADTEEEIDALRAEYEQEIAPHEENAANIDKFIEEGKF